MDDDKEKSKEPKSKELKDDILKDVAGGTPIPMGPDDALKVRRRKKKR